MRRRAFALGGAAAAALGLAGCELSLRDGVLNDCKVELPKALREHPGVVAAWRGIDAAKVWDTHAHIFGDGDSGEGLWFNPRMDTLWRPREHIQKRIYVNAACVEYKPGRTDASFVERLLAQCNAMPDGFKVMLFAFDWAHDDSGVPNRERSTYHAPDAVVASLAAKHPARIEWVASIHPYDPRAVDRIDAALARGAKAVKWLPSAQNIDPASPRCDAFYAKLAATRLPLISHAGDEQAVHGFGEHLGNPLRLRRPLDAGVRVVVAHCASLGEGEDLDQKGSTAPVPNFKLFARLMDEPRYKTLLRADISAVVQFNRIGVLDTLLERRDWQPRLLNGSDYPLPGVLPLIDLRGMVQRGWLDASMVEPLLEMRHANVLLFDFVLKRSLKRNSQGFAASVFETAPYFAR